MGPLIVTTDAELSREEVQACAEASFVLGHPHGLGRALLHKLTGALEACQAAEGKKARIHSLRTLQGFLAKADDAQARTSHPGRAEIGQAA